MEGNIHSRNVLGIQVRSLDLITSQRKLDKDASFFVFLNLGRSKQRAV